LVRRSPNHPDDYVLSVSENGRVSQYIVKRQHDNTYTIGDQNFTDLPQVTSKLKQKKAKNKTKNKKTSDTDQMFFWWKSFFALIIFTSGY